MDFTPIRQTIYNSECVLSPVLKMEYHYEIKAITPPFSNTMLKVLIVKDGHNPTRGNIESWGGDVKREFIECAILAHSPQ